MHNEVQNLTLIGYDKRLIYSWLKIQIYWSKMSIEESCSQLVNWPSTSQLAAVAYHIGIYRGIGTIYSRIYFASNTCELSNTFYNNVLSSSLYIISAEELKIWTHDIGIAKVLVLIWREYLALSCSQKTI